MSKDRMFTNPDFGKEVRIEQFDNNEVHLIFCARTEEKATALVDKLLDQLQSGAVNLTLMSKPSSVVDDGKRS